MRQYYTLITSLPRHANTFKVTQTPLSRIQLEKRLQLIPKNEITLLNNLMYVVWHSWFMPLTSSAVLLSRAESLVALHDPFITDLIQWFFNLRSLIAALRLRKIQDTPVAPTTIDILGNVREKLIKNWQQPDFNLKRTYPWLFDLDEKMSNHQSDYVEDTLLNIIWKHLQLIDSRHYFDRAALILYLLRWHIVDYWSRFNEKIAHERFTELADRITLKGQVHERA